MVPIEGGGRRKCTVCRNRAYPRTDPVYVALYLRAGGRRRRRRGREEEGREAYG
jgi:NADH pyrophosphatase NudC (nudix superfamily)